MNVIRTRLHVAADGSISGHAPHELPPGEHEAEIAIQPAGQSALHPAEAELWARIRALQDEVARLPVLDPRHPDEILGCDKNGLFG